MRRLILALLLFAGCAASQQSTETEKARAEKTELLATFIIVGGIIIYASTRK